MREDGFYWVRTCVPNAGWEIAEVSDGFWYVCGSEMTLGEGDFAEIGERITRDGK